MIELTPLDLYYWGRFVLGAIGVFAWAILTIRVVPYAARATTFRLRVFYVTAVWELAIWTLILFASNVYQLLNRPTALPDAVPIALGVFLSANVAAGGVILARMFPTPQDG